MVRCEGKVTDYAEAGGPRKARRAADVPRKGQQRRVANCQTMSASCSRTHSLLRDAGGRVQELSQGPGRGWLLQCLVFILRALVVSDGPGSKQIKSLVQVNFTATLTSHSEAPP